MDTGEYDPLAGKPTGVPYYDPLAGKPTGVPYMPFESGFPTPYPGAPETGFPLPGGGGGDPRHESAANPQQIFAPNKLPPPRPKDQVAAQNPNLGYYGQTNLDPLGRGGRRLGGPLDAPQSTAIDLSKLFQRPQQ
jgi:hypothetical protein